MVGGLGSMEWEDGGNLYSCQVAANTLFCCSCCAETHSYFLSNESVHELLSGDFDFDDLAIRYRGDYDLTLTVVFIIIV